MKCTQYLPASCNKCGSARRQGAGGCRARCFPYPRWHCSSLATLFLASLFARRGRSRIVRIGWQLCRPRYRTMDCRDELLAEGQRSACWCACSPRWRRFRARKDVRGASMRRLRCKPPKNHENVPISWLRTAYKATVVLISTLRAATSVSFNRMMSEDPTPSR